MTDKNHDELNYLMGVLSSIAHLRMAGIAVFGLAFCLLSVLNVTAQFSPWRLLLEPATIAFSFVGGYWMLVIASGDSVRSTLPFFAGVMICVTGMSTFIRLGLTSTGWGVEAWLALGLYAAGVTAMVISAFLSILFSELADYR